MKRKINTINNCNHIYNLQERTIVTKNSQAYNRIIFACLFPLPLSFSHTMQVLEIKRILISRVVLLNIYLGNSKSRAPLFLQNIKANAAIAVDIWVENLCPECHLKNTFIHYKKNEKIHWQRKENTEISILVIYLLKSMFFPSRISLQQKIKLLVIQIRTCELRFCI